MVQKLYKISQQTFWQILGKAVTSLATFIVLAMVARSYGEAGTGIYTLAVTYFAIFFIFADFGFNAHVLKRVQGTGYKVQLEWRKLLGTRIIWSSALVILAVGLLPFLPFATGDFAKAVIIASPAIIVYAVFVTCNLIFQSKLRYELSTVATSLGAIGWLLVIMWFIQLKLSVPFLVLSHLLGWIVITASALVLLKKLIQTLNPEFNLGYTKKLFKDSWPIAATLAVNVVYFRADAFILVYFKGASDVGIYNLAYQLFQSVLVLPTFIMNSFYPMMLETLRVNLDHFAKQIKFAVFSLIIFSLVTLTTTYLLSPFLIELITGAGFTGSAKALRILSFGFPGYFLSALLMWVMVAKKMYRRMLSVYILGLGFSLIFNFLYIPHYSYLAASWITVISEYLILGMQIVVLYLGEVNHLRRRSFSR